MVPSRVGPVDKALIETSLGSATGRVAHMTAAGAPPPLDAERGIPGQALATPVCAALNDAK
jgi:hypothetical protein